MDNLNIMAILIGNRTDDATKVQKILTKHGCIIETRLGLPNVIGDGCSNKGAIILRLDNKEEQINNLKAELESLSHVKTENIQLSFNE